MNNKKFIHCIYESIKNIREVMNNSESSPQIRIRAASMLLSFFSSPLKNKGEELREIIEKALTEAGKSEKKTSKNNKKKSGLFYPDWSSFSTEELCIAEKIFERESVNNNNKNMNQ